MMEYYVKIRLNAEQISDTKYIIHLSNGKQIEVEEQVEYNGVVWAWKVDNQYFSKDTIVLSCLKSLIVEKLTGVRVIYHEKREAPNICGVDGCACRHPGKCNTMLCSDCPVAEKFFADRDGVELIYAV